MDQQTHKDPCPCSDAHRVGTYVGQGNRGGLLKQARRIVASWEPTYRRGDVVRVNCRPRHRRDPVSPSRASSALDAYGSRDADDDATFITSA